MPTEQLEKALENDIEMMHWAKAAKHKDGGGAEEGIYLLHVKRKIKQKTTKGWE